MQDFKMADYFKDFNKNDVRINSWSKKRNFSVDIFDFYQYSYF